jgi:hypothetical protein
MPKIIVTHEVDDVAHWLASPKRAEVFAGVATDITPFVHPDDSHRVALSMDVPDVEAFEAVVNSPAGAAAVKHDGVRLDTRVVYVAG